MKISVIGLGYVGIGNICSLRNHEIYAYDISIEKINSLKRKECPIEDEEASSIIKHSNHIYFSNDFEESILDSEYVLISVPTNYDENIGYFDTSLVTDSIQKIREINTKCIIVIKSTIPVGYCDSVNDPKLLFSPEFLREGTATRDCLNPSRTVIGGDKKLALKYIEDCLMETGTVILTGYNEAESIKLFSNTYLAMRVAFFNELDTYCVSHNLNTRDIINGVCLDPRIGGGYNNPSLGYGGYCLPKDTKQLLMNFENIPNNLIRAIVDSNETRKKFIACEILKLKPKSVGVVSFSMKKDSDNIRDSAILDIVKILSSKGVKIFTTDKRVKDLNLQITIVEKLKDCDLYLMNRIEDRSLTPVFSRDIFNVN